MHSIIHHFFRLGSVNATRIAKSCPLSLRERVRVRSIQYNEYHIAPHPTPPPGGRGLCNPLGVNAGVPAKLFAFVSLFVSFAAAETPQTLAHWVRLTDGSLLVGRIEYIDGERLRIDLRLEPQTIVSIPRRNIASLIVIPPVDPAEAGKILAFQENEKAETIRLVGGGTLSGRLRSFSNGMFRFDLFLGGPEELFLESQSISWRRVRSIHLVFQEKEKIKGRPPIAVFLKNGSKILCEHYESSEDGTVVINNPCFSDLKLPACSLIPSFPQRLP